MYTLPNKKRNFNFQIFYGDPGPRSLTQGYVHMAKSSLTYAPLQKKGNFKKVVFLLGKSVQRFMLDRPFGKAYSLTIITDTKNPFLNKYEWQPDSQLPYLKPESCDHLVTLKVKNVPSVLGIHCSNESTV